MIDWDEWRASYDAKSYAEHVAFYDRVWELHPDQQHYDADRVGDFLDAYRPHRIFELGGWRGELAARLLPGHPEIDLWANWEICRGAAEHAVLQHPHYIALQPPDWVWNHSSPYDAYDAFLGSHVIEHMRAAQLGRLVDRIAASPIKAVYLAAPLTEEPLDWHGYGGSHILELGWNGVADLFYAAGFACDLRFWTNESRVFNR